MYEMCFRKDYSTENKLVLRLMNESDEVSETASQPNSSQGLEPRTVFHFAEEELTLGNQCTQTNTWPEVPC